MARVALDFVSPKQELRAYPPVEQWDDWMEYDSTEWPKRVEKHYMLVPTVCFNCEAGCGLLAYLDKETLQIRKFEGNPTHPGSRGRNCAKGPATYNQVTDPERILYPLKRAGKRGEGKWERVTWDAVLDDIGGRIRKAIAEGRRNEIMYHVGRPGADGYMDRVLQAWGVDAHNSHTNVCSAAARLGYSLWHGYDRPSPDYANARFILLISSHLETGHYFNPHAQRIIEAKMRGAKLAVMDTRLSNTASMADYWLPSWPGSEAAVLLAMALVILKENLYDREFLRRWTNWQEFMANEPNVPDVPNMPNLQSPITNYQFDDFIERLKQHYAPFTPEFAEKESGIPAQTIVEIAREIGRAGSAFATHVWRSAATGNLGGWQVARCLEFLNVLVGAVATPGGTTPNGYNKFVANPPLKPPPQKVWNELLMPKEYPLAFFEMSFLLPHFLKDGRGKLDTYFTRVYNPVWTNPDGASWMEVLSDESLVGCHAALTPTWSETAWFADYVLPMGHGPERHDLMSYETHAAQWIAFRQPVRRVAMEKQGKKVNFTYEANPGQVWEEDEFWIELSWRIDPDGALGIRKFFESPYRPGEKMTITEYYQWIFENSIPGLPEAAAKERCSPLEYMRKYAAFTIKDAIYRPYETQLPKTEDAHVDPNNGVVKKNGAAVGVEIDGQAYTGFPTPSRKLEIYSRTMKDWKWNEYTLPAYIKSHVHPDQVNRAQNEFVLLSTFRLPTMIHTRSANAKWLVEISHKNPAWMHTSDARKLGLQNGDLIRVTTDIGFFVDKVWVTESIRPGVIACSHHMGRWRLDASGGSSWLSAHVKLERNDGQWKMRQLVGVKPFKSDDPDSMRIWWSEVGVHQNLTFPVHPDPISGMHCWHQKVTIAKAQAGDQYGDIFVDTHKAHQVYKEWLAMTRPAPGPDNLRRPLWMPRPIKPDANAYKIDS
ncbi:MAG: molybdopterin-dependent oxidoreductase [Chloroflexi bacterium]|nr:molybdopterin-dependent oxidoreductase [Chloroflexota bacterium]